MSKKTVLTVLVLVAATAAVLPMLSCDEEKLQPQNHSLFVVQPPETLTVAHGTYWAKQYSDVSAMMFGYYDKVTLSMGLQCVGTFPDSNPKWYILNSDQYTAFGLGSPNQQFMNATLGASGCSMWVDVLSTQTGTYWAVIDNRREPTHDIKVTGSVYLRYYGL
jgi:hypothetical protein